MNIVILHCHFERGGVTQVVENHVRWLHACDQVEQVVLVSGSRVSGLSEQTRLAVTQVVVDDFDYDSPSEAIKLPHTRAESMVQELQSKLAELGVDPSNALLHWHNHGLGKNTAAPAAIHRLARSGWRLLLQIHDFAEDNRPANLLQLMEASGATKKADLDRYLYPIATQIHYATLTSTDATTLKHLGIPEPSIHRLPNGVTALPDEVNKEAALASVRRAMGLPEDATWCLYPVRGIRRKNVGEFVLLCRWLPPQMHGGLTLSPTTPVERQSYERWRSVAAELAPRAVFDAAHHPAVSFSETMAAAEFALSTSVAEGFGMTFLEPWLAGREVIARRLPMVIDDLEAAGVQFSKLYDQIPIPGNVDWVRQCQAEAAAATQQAWQSLPHEFRPTLEPPGNLDGDWVDFAKLTPHRQVEVLKRFDRDPKFERATKAASADLVASLAGEANPQQVAANAGVIRQSYSPEQTGRKLVDVYRQLFSASCERDLSPPVHAGAGVDLIASARQCFPCRTEVFDD